MDNIVSLANNLWNIWLFALFAGVVIWALWPSKRRKQEMDHAANIPLMDDETRAKPGA
ncbi:cbb3-type cytochrome c oxidase subunit 3 [Aestuariispira ectoiniformans]|uniref:cbb3-type cytochrome c oxidase subunit 3 n=1 Tax=Aestuariispira ectoiniformans TaxID=2775080 RepID=UPI00223BEE9C|nr:cbb3-type cytochrome c oxidase subunit 3 [Aestuariispira ectoiniformans]